MDSAMQTGTTRLIGCAAALAALAFLLSPAAVRAQPGAPTAGVDAPHWTVFSDPLGTTVDYPENIFSVDAGSTPRGTGLVLRSADDRAALMIYVEDNEARHTPASFVRAYLAAPRGQLDYNRVTARFFAISGVNDDQIYYSRCNFPSGVRGPAHCIYLAYPKEEERRWDAIVTRISRSLRPSG
jgi:hypothetical protein